VVINRWAGSLSRTRTKPGVVQQSSGQHRQTVLGIFQYRGNLVLGTVTTLGHDQAKFREQPPQLINERGALLDEARSHPMQAENGLLFIALDRHEAHAGPSHRLANGLGVVAVVLAALAVGGDEARGHDPDPVTEPPQFPAPVMGARAGLHADQTRRELGEARQQLRPGQGLPQHDPAVLIHPVQTEHCLCQIDPDGSNVHGDSSCSVD
jgi:hypothetical protein